MYKNNTIVQFNKSSITLGLGIFLFFALPIYAGLGLQQSLISETLQPDAFPLVTSSQQAGLCYDIAEDQGVIRAIGDLQADIERVTNAKPTMGPSNKGKIQVIIGTLGRNKIIDSLVTSGKLDDSDLKGKRESFVITTMAQPSSGIDHALVIAGSDKRGTIYGIYELSEQLGVSPWYWWADVPVKTKKEAYILPGRYASGEPAVKYRGIFINDEEPCFGPWAREKFGGINSEMYAHMFELILRLRGNYLWPAMWGKAFNEDDPANPKVANEYGIVMGTSHHEPMIRAQAEWTKRSKDIGNGQWNYATNGEGLRKFWTDGIQRNKDYESLVTIGMRGDGDEPMIKGGDMADNVKLLEQIVADQRQILADYMNPDVTQIPQMWALYKEVAHYYDAGMRVPDDVTLLWCDDNWGNIRRLPTPEERKRSGGAGIYYHFDYVGGPRCYKWINTNPLPKVWEQMNMAYEYGANQIWVVNVGDLKPMELPIEFFLRMAWNPRALPKEKIADFTRQWAQREFGPTHADDIADIVSKYAKYNGWRKPELLEPGTYSLIHYQEAERVEAAWQAITTHAEAIYEQLTSEYRDAYFQLVLHPTKASATVAQMYIAAGRNHLYAAQGRVSANQQAERVQDLFDLDQQLSDSYHRLNDGKWNHMMAQTHIGYRSWRDPRTNIMPRVTEVTPGEGAKLGVAIEGSELAWPGPAESATLPPFDSLNCQKRWIEIFNRAGHEADYNVTANQPWVKLSQTSGILGPDQRIWIQIDWKQIPVGKQQATLTVTGADMQSVLITLNAVRSERFTADNTQAFGGLTGPVAIAAESAVKNIPVGKVSWEEIPDYGRGISGMSVFPATARSILPPHKAPCLEYPVFIAKAGDVKVNLITGTGLKVQPDRGVRIAVSFDDQAPQVIDAFADQASGGDGAIAPAFHDWDNWVRDNARSLISTHSIASPGVHTLKVWMVDPGVVLQSLIVSCEDYPKSYFGPLPTTLRENTHWVGTWASSAQEVEAKLMPEQFQQLSDTTLRQIVRVSIGGDRLRVRLSNAFADWRDNLEISAVTVAESTGDKGIVSGTAKTLTFSGKTSVTIPYGTLMVSDPLAFELKPGSDLAVTMHVNKAPKKTTGHRSARGEVVFIQAGDAVNQTLLKDAVANKCWYYLCGVEVTTPTSSAAVICLGDSITDGKGSTEGQNRRWPDYLARRLQANPDTAEIGILNQGIGGNCLWSGGLGQPVLQRLERDVLAQPGARWVIVLEGINDLGGGHTTADEIITSLQQVIAQAQACSLLVYGSTILPCGDSFYFKPQLEAKRLKINHWIRTSNAFDAVIDWDAVVRDPQNPSKLRPEADCGDHLHLSDEGYRMMAESVDLSLFMLP